MVSELLLPAGSPVKLKTAILYGADAVYAGTPDMSLRTQSQFSLDDIREGIDFVHAAGKKIYLTLNLYTHNKDVEKLPHFVDTLRRLKPDGVLIADPGVFLYLKEHAPELKRFVSTQANICSYQTVKFWQSLGADLCVLGREVSFAEMAEIRRQCPDIMLETFVHGAMCMSYSGRCLLSNFLVGRDANQGACTHPCRWKYAVVEEKRPGEYLPVYENERGTYIFNSKDLCMIEHIPDLLDAGIDSFKIEGRMKTALYVATVARTYRKAVDDYLEDPKLYEEHMPWYRTQIASCTYRQFTTGFFYGRPDENTQIYDNNTYVKEYTYLGIVGEVDAEGRCRIEQRNKFSVGEQIEIMKPDGQNVEVTVKRILNEDGEEQESAPHSKQILHIELEGGRAEAYDILRRKE